MNTKLQILIVENDPEEISVIRNFLSASNNIQFDIISANTLAEACNVLETQRIDMILLDTHLEDCQGFEAFNLINEAAPDTPIIILSDTANEDIALSALRAGAQDYFIKGMINERNLSRAISYAIERNNLIEKLKESELIIENAKVAIYNVNLDGVIQTWNKSAEKIYGYAADEIIGQHISQLTPYELKNEFDNMLKTIKSGKSIIELITRRICKDRTIIEIAYDASPVFSHNRLSGVSIISKEISKQKLLTIEQSIQHRITTIFNELTDTNETMRAILETLCHVLNWKNGEVWLLDKADNLLHYTSGWYTNNIYSELEPINKKTTFHIKEGLPGHIWKIEKPYWIANLSADKLCTRKATLLNLGINSILGFPIMFQKEVSGVLLLFNTNTTQPDKSLLKILPTISYQIGLYINQKNLKTEKYFLQEQLVIKNSELNNQAEFLKKSEKNRNIFFDNMSHELRTPLNGIIGFTEIMYNDVKLPISTVQKEFLGDILKSARNLLYVLTNILEISRIESGKVELHSEPTNLAKLVNDVQHSISLFISEKRITFNTQIDPSLFSIVTDPDKFKVILFNYLYNAINFTPSGGKITVRIQPEDNSYFRLEVNDTGIGINNSEIENLFVKHGQQYSNGVSQIHEKVGLGLSLTRQIAELLGGRVGVISNPGSGSTFYVVLPLDVNRTSH